MKESSLFHRQKILVLGDVFLDEYILGASNRISPEAPVPIIQVDSTRFVLGGAGNTAFNAASLNSKVWLMGAVGKDDEGWLIGRICRGKKIGFLPLNHQGSTIRKTRVLAQNQQLMRLDFESITPLSKSLQKRALGEIHKKLNVIDVLVFSDYDKGFFSEEFCRSIIRMAKKKGKLIIADPKPQNARFFNGVDYLTPNWKESMAMAGLPYQPLSLNLVSKVAKILAEKFNTSPILTLGEAGLYFHSKDKRNSFHLPTQAREVFDVSGAGDTVVAVLALALAAGYPTRQAADFANRAAGAVVAKRGTASVIPEDLQESDRMGSGLLDKRSLVSVSNDLRKKGKKIVTLNGSFDLLHSGHLYIIRQARSQGDVLIIGLNSDSSVRKYKGKKRPLVEEKRRAEMLLALRDVDFVHLFDEPNPIAFIKTVKPDVHVNGKEYGKNCIEAHTVKKLGARLHLVDRIPGLSTTELSGKINSRRK